MTTEHEPSRGLVTAGQDVEGSARRLLALGLTPADCENLSQMAYALTQVRGMHEQVEGFRRRVPEQSDGADYVFREVYSRRGAIENSLGARLEQLGVSPGGTADDAHWLWRALREACRLARAA